MKKALRDEWVAALRSGKYEQGTGKLRTDDDHWCCLGVLSDVAGVKWDLVEDRNVYSSIPGQLCCYYPTQDQIDEWGLAARHSWTLAQRNDGEWHDCLGHKYTFAEQADWIEENIPCESE